MSPVEPCPSRRNAPGWAGVWFGSSLVARQLKKVTLNRAAPARTCTFVREFAQGAASFCRKYEEVELVSPCRDCPVAPGGI